MATRTSIVGGSAVAPLNWEVPATWGGVVPIDGDDVIIPPQSYVKRNDVSAAWVMKPKTILLTGWLLLDATTRTTANSLVSVFTVASGGVGEFKGAGYNYSFLMILAGGSFAYTVGATHHRPIAIVRGGGLLTFNAAGSNNGAVTVESGGLVTLNDQITSASVYIEAGGAVNTTGTCYNYGTVVVESGASLTKVSGSYIDSGITATYSQATVTGITAIAIATYRRTAHQIDNYTNVTFGSTTMYALTDPAINAPAPKRTPDTSIGGVAGTLLRRIGVPGIG